MSCQISLIQNYLKAFKGIDPALARLRCDSKILLLGLSAGNRSRERVLFSPVFYIGYPLRIVKI